MAESGGLTDINSTNDIPNWQFLLDACELNGDPRSAWEALSVCLELNLPIPMWVRSYFIASCKKISKISRAQSPLKLWEALGLVDEKKRSQYNPLQDPEEIYDKIEIWRTAGQVKSISAGARKYLDEILKGVGKEETVRSKYRIGRDLWRSYDAKGQ